MSFLADPENRLSAKSTKVAICITVATLVERELQEVAQQGSRLVRLTMISTPSLQKNLFLALQVLIIVFSSLCLFLYYYLGQELLQLVMKCSFCVPITMT